MVLEKTLESPLDFVEIQPVNTKGNQSRIFNGRTDAEAEVPILWPHDAKNWLTGKDPNAGQNWSQEEKGITEGKMDGVIDLMDMSLQALGVGDGQGSLVSCSPWGRKESDTTVQLNWTELNTWSNWAIPLLTVQTSFSFIWGVMDTKTLWDKTHPSPPAGPNMQSLQWKWRGILSYNS